MFFSDFISMLAICNEIPPVDEENDLVLTKTFFTSGALTFPDLLAQCPTLN